MSEVEPPKDKVFCCDCKYQSEEYISSVRAMFCNAQTTFVWNFVDKTFTKKYCEDVNPNGECTHFLRAE